MTSLLAPKRNGHNFTAGGFVVGAVSGIVAAASVYPASFLLMAFFISSTRVELSQNLLRGAALFPMVFIPALIVSSAHMLLLGVPLILLMEHFRILKLWSISLAGFLAGCISVLIITGAPETAFWSGVIGTIGAGTFWFTARL